LSAKIDFPNRKILHKKFTRYLETRTYVRVHFYDVASHIKKQKSNGRRTGADTGGDASPASPRHQT